MKEKCSEENAGMQIKRELDGEYSKAIPQPAIDRFARFMLKKLQEVPVFKNQAA